jgi:hypothetical protein
MLLSKKNVYYRRNSMSQPLVRVVLYGTGPIAEKLAQSIERRNVRFMRNAPGRGMVPNALVMVVSWGKNFQPEIFYGEDKILSGIAILPHHSAKLEKPKQPRPQSMSAQRIRGRGDRR